MVIFASALPRTSTYSEHSYPHRSNRSCIVPILVVPAQSRKRLFHVILPPGNVYFTWFHLPKYLVLRDSVPRKRLFHVISPPGNVGFTLVHLPKTLHGMR